MKFTHSLFLIAHCVFILSACSKKVSEPQAADASGKYELAPAFVTRVTPEQAALLDSLMAHGKITNPVDFKNKVDFLTTQSAKKAVNSGILSRIADDDGGYNSATDYFLGTIASDPYSGDVIFEDATTRTVSSVYQVILTYIKRGNQVLVRVPYQYDWTIDYNTMTNTISNLRPTTRVELLPTGSYWGEVTQGDTWYVNPGGIYGDDPQHHAVAISAYGSAQEKRTYINTVEGTVKISTKANLAGFEAGAEIEGGYHVSSAWNIYNQYSMNADGQIWKSPTIQTFPTPPAQFIGRTNATQFGILKNQ